MKITVTLDVEERGGSSHHAISASFQDSEQSSILSENTGNLIARALVAQDTAWAILTLAYAIRAVPYWTDLELDDASIALVNAAIDHVQSFEARAKP